MLNGELRKSRRQQLGLPDRWRLLERLDSTVMIFVPDKYMDNEGEHVWKRLIFSRKSQIEELKKQYGDDMEVL